jgi:glycosyltransferase involved in cell wall biosynthesis
MNDTSHSISPDTETTEPIDTNNSNKKTSAVDVSIVIPVYNEEGILSASIADLTEKLESMEEWAFDYEIILTENGSTDQTVPLARELQQRHPELRILHHPEPNYGYALRRGILEARGDYVICDEIDLCDTDFYIRAMGLLEGGKKDMIIGSKTLRGSADKRPLYRQLATRVLNFLLHVFLGFEGTDTHGLKAFNREKILDVVDECVVDQDLFARELVIRAERVEEQIKEMPLTVTERRKPSSKLFKRVPNVLSNLARLFWVIRIAHR